MLNQNHKKNIIHRDLKPENIMIIRTEENPYYVKLLDFGLAKLRGLSQLTSELTTVGTLHYMSPEQFSGDPVDSRTDIWSLGVILYELLAGERPFKGDYEQAVIYSIINEDPEFISKIRADVPLELEKIIDRALSKNPEKPPFLPVI